MNKCDLDKLKKLGWDGVYDLIQKQQKQIDEQKKEINNLWNKILVLNLKLDKMIINSMRNPKVEKYLELED